MSLQTNLLSWWKLEESTASSTWVDSHTTGNDLSNNSSGTGVTSATGKQGNGALFASASSEYLSSSTDPGPTGDWSVAFWVKLTSNSAYAWPFYSGSGGNSGFGVRFENDNKIFAQFGQTAPSKVRTTAAQVSSTGTWYHIAVTADVSAGASGFTIYVNGSSVALTTVANADTALTAVANTTLGCANGSQFLNGELDEVGIWNAVLTADEVLALYNNGSGITYSDTGTLTDVSSNNLLTEGLVSYWELEESTASATWTDSHSSNDLSNNSSGSGVTSATGKQGNCASMASASSEYLDISDAAQTGLDITGDLSISCWIYADTLSGAFTSIASKTVTSVANRSWIFEATSTNLRFYSCSAVSSGCVDLQKAHGISTGGWYHVAAVYDASAATGYLFVNGSSIGSGACATALANSAAPFELGACSDLSRYWDGDIDEFGIYNRKLTTYEIQQLYASGSGLPYLAAATSIKSVNGLAQASVGKINGVAIASVKSFNGLSNVS